MILSKAILSLWLIASFMLCEAEMSMKKFRGCLVGAVLGDCYGAPFENEPIASKTRLQSYFDELEGPSFKTPQYLYYTDDTAMTKVIADSLIRNNGFNGNDMAEKFVKEYFTDKDQSRRGYGIHVRDVFRKLNDTHLDDIWKPAAEQFNGAGSYGNGGAMRISPVALFFHKDYDKMLEIAEKVTKLTHTHPLGINGAKLQCIAIYLSLKSDPEKPLDIANYVKQLIEKISIVESKTKREVTDKISYSSQLVKLQRLLELGDDVSDIRVIKDLGNTIEAHYSVPIAIYCFLRAQQPISEIKSDNPFRRTIQYAISLGGDTDTIATMAGAIAGAYYGIDAINKNLMRSAQAADFMDSLAVKMFELLR